MTIRHKSIIDGQKHANAIHNEQSRIRRPLVAQVRREIAAGEYDQHLDTAIDRLIETGDLAVTPRCQRCDGLMPVAAFRHGDEMICVTCYRAMLDANGSAMEGDRWE